MKKVNTFVELIDSETSNVVYAVLFTGVMTRRYIYAKRTSTTSQYDDVKYISIAKHHTEDITSQTKSIWKAIHRAIKVPADVAFHDPRIKVLTEEQIPEQILTTIKNVAEEQMATIKAAI